MYNFILQIIIMFSLGVMIYLIARAAPRVGDIEEIFKKQPLGDFDKLIAKMPISKIDFILSAWVEKTLRKIKLILMKWDNLLSEHLNRVKKINGNGGMEEKQTLFNKPTEEKKEEEQKVTSCKLISRGGGVANRT